MNINLMGMLRADDLAIEELSSEEGKAKLGTFRAGSGGLSDVAGTHVGTCMRRAWLRSIGIEEGTGPDRSIMFEGGRHLEELVVRKLVRMLPEGYTVLREADTPTRWVTSKGVPVTGSPDIVVQDDGGTKVLGIELKKICSLWTAKDVIHKGEPKLAHLVQAAHYMWQLDIPYKLLYIQDVDYQSPMWTNFDAGIPADSPLVVRNASGKVVKFLPTRMAFDLRLVEGKLSYRAEGSTGDWTPTIVDIGRIMGYYEGLSDMGPEAVLPSRPKVCKADGSPGTYNPCEDRYCSFSGACDRCGDGGTCGDLAELLRGEVGEE